MSAEDDRRFQEIKPELRQKLAVYADILAKWQKKINLVSSSTMTDVWRRHFLDSLQLTALAGEWSNWADLGSGGGFPGLVIAMAAGDGGRAVHLIEADKRKAAFLREVSRETHARAVVHVGRIETMVPELSSQIRFDVVSARALAPLSTLLAYSRPMLDNGAVGLFMKGKGLADELTAVPADATFDLTFAQSQTDAQAKIVVVRRRNILANPV